jgi:hypothetical protein
VLTEFLAGVVAGAAPCSLIIIELTRRLRRKPANQDYKERWLTAISLLGDEGQLTGEQLTQLAASSAVAEPVSSPVPAAGTGLHDMFSSDRADMEIARARNGKPPLDDLADMFSSDKKAVLKARAKYGTR